MFRNISVVGACIACSTADVKKLGHKRSSSLYVSQEEKKKITFVLYVFNCIRNIIDILISTGTIVVFSHFSQLPQSLEEPPGSYLNIMTQLLPLATFLIDNWLIRISLEALSLKHLSFNKSRQLLALYLKIVNNGILVNR
jgi:hypothetical protein